MNKLAIAIFTPFFSAGDELESGIGVHYRDLAIGLKQYGNDVVVFHFPYDTTECKSWDFEGIKVHSVGFKTLGFTKIRGIGLLCNMVKFFDFFEAFQLFAKSRIIFSKYHSLKSFDIIEASSNRGVALGVSTLRKRPPIFTRVSTTMNQVFQEYDEQPDLNYRLAARFEISQIKRSDFLVTHTKNHAKITAKDIRIDQSRFSIIPHAISLTTNPNISNSRSDNFVRILFVGRLEARKGIDILISAIPKILEKNQNVIFDICGSGDHLPYQLEFGLQKKVFFHGYQSRDSLEQFYKICDIFVAPSRYESFGLVYLEAMRFGKPVVACNSGGTPEVIEHKKTGLLVEPGKVRPLVKAILHLISNPNYRHLLGNSGKKRCKELFSIERLLDSTLLNYRVSLSNYQQN